MTTIDTTLSKKENKPRKFEVPIVEFMKLKINSLSIVKGFLMGTESDEWLKEAEDGRHSN